MVLSVAPPDYMSATKEAEMVTPVVSPFLRVAAATETPNENMVERSSLLQQTRWSMCWRTQQIGKHREGLKAERDALRVPRLAQRVMFCEKLWSRVGNGFEIKWCSTDVKSASGT